MRPDRDGMGDAMTGPDTVGVDSWDVIVLGAGAGGMAAAAVAAREGLKTLVIEKTGYVGGTTAFSGGMVWVPNNLRMASEGRADSLEAAQQYLAATAGPGGALRQVYLERAPEAIDYLDRNTDVHLVPLAFYPDYYPDLPGATTGGRVMEPRAFDAKELGDAFRFLRAPLPEFTLLGGMMVARPDIPHFRNLFRSFRSALKVAMLVLSYAAERLRYHRGTRLVLGNALAGRLLKSLLGLGVTIRRNTAVRRLVVRDGRVTGVEVDSGGGIETLTARRGVVLATGGFSHNQEMRRRFLPNEAGPVSATAEGATGDGLRLGTEAGGDLPAENANDAFWVPASTFSREDGSPGVYPHTVTDRGKPGMFAVNAAGRRFTNESNSYHEFVHAMFRTSNESPAIPAWLICDKRSLWQYGLGAVKPMCWNIAPYKRSRYLKEAPSIAALAETIGVDAAALEQTVATYNADALTGEDSLFGRGGNAYHRYVGDPANSPNPCMRPVETAPYYAVALVPADLGTAAGLRTGPNAEVLDSAGHPVPGLYACGNDMNSIMEGSYPGPGITLGPALVFGYLAAKHMADADGRLG
jgi:succinate dehydrogenase/fumarate reductase flavoprotein subunit